MAPAFGAGDDGDAPTCCICLDEYECGDTLTRMPCRHDFHTDCIGPWLERNRSCPLCKQDVFEMHFGPDGPAVGGGRLPDADADADADVPLLELAAAQQEADSPRTARRWSRLRWRQVASGADADADADAAMDAAMGGGDDDDALLLADLERGPDSALEATWPTRQRPVGVSHDAVPSAAAYGVEFVPVVPSPGGGTVAGGRMALPAASGSAGCYEGDGATLPSESVV